MATLSETFDLQLSTPLRNRCHVAVQVAALAVFSENPATGNHAERLALAKRVLTSTAEAVRYGEMFHRIAALSTLAAAGEASDDAAVQAAVTGLFTAVAVVGL